MKIKMKTVMVSAFICVTAPASATTIYASGPVYAGQTANDPVTCRFFNPGSTSITFSDIAIVNNLGDRVDITGNSCGGSIASLHTCIFTASSPGNQSFVCYGVLTGTGSKADVTGTAEIRTTSSTVVTQPIVRQQ